MRIITMVTMILTIVLTTCVMGWTQTGQGIKLSATAEVEIKTLDTAGRSVISRIPADKVMPGTQVIYTIHYINAGDQPARHVAITNPIPTHMRFQPGGVFGPNSAITFSIDGGKTFDRPENLFIMDQAGRRFPARPTDYTHIRWVLEKPLGPQAKGQVGFRAVLE
jgi:uncharacterized repeat protein (TIGR01451 family)